MSSKPNESIPSVHQGNARYTLKATGADAKNYDFTSARPPGPKTNVIESIGHLIKSCLGGGIVTIHTAYKTCGLWTSLILNVFLAFIVTYLMVVLAQSAQRVYGRAHVGKLSYPDLAEATLAISKYKTAQKLSKAFRYLVDFTIMIDLFGSCCCYQVIIANAIYELAGMWGLGDWNIRYVIAGLIIPCILICMILTLKYLAPFTLAADFVIVVVTIFTVVYAVQLAPKSPLEYPPFKDVTGLLTFVGVCVFSMEGVGVTLPIENQMQDPKKITLVLWLGMCIVATIVMTVGFFGYWGFGEASQSPVTVNFPQGPVPTVMKIGMAGMVYVTFGLNFWVPFDLAWAYIQKKYDTSKHWFVQRIYRTIFIIVISIVSIIFPDVTNLMSVIGVFCLTNMGFIYPSVIQLLLDMEEPDGFGKLKWRLWKFIAILIFAFFIMIFGTVSNIIELFKASFSK